MKAFAKTGVALAMTAALALAGAGTALAYSPDPTQTFDGTTGQQTNALATTVEYTLPVEYTVKVPATITLSQGEGDALSGTGTVCVDGYIQKHYGVTVQPQTRLWLSESGGATLAVNSKSKLVFTQEEFGEEGKDITYTSSLLGAYAGEYSGTAKYAISYDEVKN